MMQFVDANARWCLSSICRNWRFPIPNRHSSWRSYCIFAMNRDFRTISSTIWFTMTSLLRSRWHLCTLSEEAMAVRTGRGLGFVASEGRSRSWGITPAKDWRSTTWYVFHALSFPQAVADMFTVRRRHSALPNQISSPASTGRRRATPASKISSGAARAPSNLRLPRGVGRTSGDASWPTWLTRARMTRPTSRRKQIGIASDSASAYFSPPPKRCVTAEVRNRREAPYVFRGSGGLHPRSRKRC
jgi:hypothetical protein